MTSPNMQEATNQLKRGLKALRLECPEAVCADLEKLVWAVVDETVKDTTRQFLEQLADIKKSAEARGRLAGLEEGAKVASPVIQYPRGHFLSCVDPLGYCTCGFKMSEKIAQAIRQRSSNE